MNEYLGRHLSFGAPGFSDVFADHQERMTKYQDTPLSPNGITLVQEQLARSRPAFLHSSDEAPMDKNGQGTMSPPPPVDLVVVSPLRRALQTYDLGLRPHLEPHSNTVPVVALPHAAERLYLISDVGSPVPDLAKDFPYVDFSEMMSNDDGNEEPWWWTPKKNKSGNHYTEWRPVGRGQKYACPGEPWDDFVQRMEQLHEWLDGRKEQKIVVVCHHGVIDYMLDMDFANCQWQQVPFSQLLAGRRRAV